MEDTIFDKLTDFQMMLEGFVLMTKDLMPTEKERDRILTAWYRLSTEVEKKLDGADNEKMD